MKTGSKQSDYKTTACLMCGAASDDFWQTRPARRILLRRRPRPGDVRNICTLCDECEEGLRSLNRSRKSLILNSKGGDDSPQNLRAICDCCNEGLQNTAPPRPDRIHLLSQVRRATIDDQEALLDWLSKKFGRRPEKLN